MKAKTKNWIGLALMLWVLALPAQAGMWDKIKSDTREATQNVKAGAKKLKKDIKKGSKDAARQVRRESKSGWEGFKSSMSEGWDSVTRWWDDLWK